MDAVTGRTTGDLGEIGGRRYDSPSSSLARARLELNRCNVTADSRLAAAAALRDLNHAFVAHDAEKELLDRIERFAREAADELRDGVRRDRAGMLASHVGRLFTGAPGDHPPEGAYNPMTDRAVGGQTNPIAAELDVERVGDEMVVRTALGAAYEGAPGRAHGGMVAALFDDITGFVLPMAGTAAYTGRITVNFRKPVPVGTELVFRARISGRDGRKLDITADCPTGEGLVATAEALFIAVDMSELGQIG